jgi:hypothetical protein
MKKVVLIFIAMLVFSDFCFAQENKGIHLQGIARNEQGLIVANKQITLRRSILNDSIGTSILYQEIKAVTTNVLGLFFIDIGENEPSKINTIGDFKTLDWSAGACYISIELDPNNAFSFKLLGTEKIQYVPKAFYADIANKVNSIVPIAMGGTGVANMIALKQLLSIDKINNTPDSLKPISASMLLSLNEKLKKVDTLSLSNRINNKISIGGINANEINAGLGFSPVKNIYGSFFDTSKQVTIINTASAVKFFFIQAANKITITNNTTALPTRVTVNEAGFYHVNYALQFVKSDPGNDEINIWIRRNGVAYANSNSILIIQGSGVKNSFNGNCFVELGNNDYIELYYFVKNVNSTIAGTPANTQTPSRPAVPSASITIHAVN